MFESTQSLYFLPKYVSNQNKSEQVIYLMILQRYVPFLLLIWVGLKFASLEYGSDFQYPEHVCKVPIS